MYKIFIGVGVAILLLGIYMTYPTPQLNKNWSLDQLVLPAATFNEDETVEISNVRNFIYSSTTEYIVQYYDVVVDLNLLNQVDYIVEPFGSIGAAHTFVSFGFSDGKQIAISVEIRKEVGESFSPWRGLAQQYELMYVVADERDVVNLRANHRLHPVYIYPTTASKEQGVALFRSMLMRANALASNPEFYNTLTSNCTTNIVSHINALVPDNKISWDHRLLLPEESDALAQELGFILPNVDIKEARKQYQVNERAKVFQNDPDFSKRIREPYVAE